MKKILLFVGPASAGRSCLRDGVPPEGGTTSGRLAPSHLLPPGGGTATSRPTPFGLPRER